MASYEKEIASKKKEESETLKACNSELKDCRKQISNLTNQLIGEKRTAQGHINQMELNEQRQTMNVATHAAKLGTATQTKAEMLAQSQLQKAQQFTTYSRGIAGMGMGSGGVQAPHMAMMNALGGSSGMMHDIWGSVGMMHGMVGAGNASAFGMGGVGNTGAFNSFQQGMNYAGGMGKSAHSSLSYLSYGVTEPQI